MTNISLSPNQGPDPSRLLLAVFLTSAILMAYSYFFPTQPMQVAEKKLVQEEKALVTSEDKEEKIDDFNESEKIDVHASATDEASIKEEKVSFLISDNKEHAIYRSSYKVESSNIGGKIENIWLTDFKKNVHITSKYLSLLSSINKSIGLKSDAKYEIKEKGQDYITFSHTTKEGLTVERSYKFLIEGDIDEKIKLKNDSEKPLKADLILLSAKIDEKKSSSSFLPQTTQASGILIKKEEDLERVPLDKIEEDSPQVFTSASYVAFDDQYFIATKSLHKKDVASFEASKQNNEIFLKTNLNTKVLMPGEADIIDIKYFVGPKQIDLLSKKQPSLEETVEFGWFAMLCRPMLWGLVRLNGLLNNFGLSIILLTLIIKLLTLPLTHKSFKSQGQMKVLAPKIKALQEKYAHDRALLGQKQMELYKEHGVNPMAGCLPIFIQLPIWFAFYRMIGFSVELFDQPFYGWITDLTTADPYYVLPLLMGGSMFLTQWLMPPQVDQPHMKYVMLGMPVFFTFIMLSLPSGLSLYLLTNNVLTIGQQLYMKRSSD